MELIKIKKDRKTNKKAFVVEMSETEYIKASNFLNNNTNGLVYYGNGMWGTIVNEVSNSGTDNKVTPVGESSNTVTTQHDEHVNMLSADNSSSITESYGVGAE